MSQLTAESQTARQIIYNAEYTRMENINCCTKTGLQWKLWKWDIGHTMMRMQDQTMLTWGQKHYHIKVLKQHDIADQLKIISFSYIKAYSIY